MAILFSMQFLMVSNIKLAVFTFMSTHLFTKLTIKTYSSMPPVAVFLYSIKYLQNILGCKGMGTFIVGDKLLKSVAKSLVSTTGSWTPWNNLSFMGSKPDEVQKVLKEHTVHKIKTLNYVPVSWFYPAEKSKDWLFNGI